MKSNFLIKKEPLLLKIIQFLFCPTGISFIYLLQCWLFFLCQKEKIIQVFLKFCYFLLQVLHSRRLDQTPSEGKVSLKLLDIKLQLVNALTQKLVQWIFLEIIYIVLTQKRLLTIFWYTKWLLWSLYGTNNCKYKILLWKWKGNKLCNFSACMSSSLKHTSEVEFLKTALWNIFNIDRIHLYNQYWRGEQTTCFWDTTVILFKEV